MKRSLLYTIILTLFIAFNAHSQVSSGFKAGVNIADITSFNFSNNGSASAGSLEDRLSNTRTGYFVGFLVDIPLTEKLSFVPEFIYSQQGVDEEDFRIDYLNLPLGLKYDFGGLYVNAGPQVGVKVWTPDQSGIFSNFEASVFGGLGYIFESNIFIEARYALGLTDIYQDNNNFTFSDGGGTSFSDLEGKNAVIQIGIGYRL